MDIVRLIESLVKSLNIMKSDRFWALAFIALIISVSFFGHVVVELVSLFQEKQTPIINNYYQ